ncbi:MAG: hypothetical protein A2086_09545 [Spirochaetes bacterium GWD1_27_9]|nr:MAG: hypothetical protein A2Z98_14075 [Spirochaetes bacterium GWB1_27_13]OHD20080.1 MAG: hypothetical protein A2Y34_14085 [Spirochaetes bacterium GWC1_27_15]OHD31647.1 MAG: hypothetical protein A2086_09545 [Spirochaetes bacterium GWD1_27_9]
MKKDYYTIKQPLIRKFIEDSTRVAMKTPSIHGVIKVDITEANKKIKEQNNISDQKISLTSYILSCISKAVETNLSLQAYKTFNGKLFIFNDVDILLPIEVKIDKQYFPIIHLLRKINKMSISEINNEILNTKKVGRSNSISKKQTVILFAFYLLPGFLRRMIFSFLLKFPLVQRNYLGTVGVTAVGMFGTGDSFGIGIPNHSLTITLGGIYTAPAIFDKQVCERKYINITISVNHDIVDGAPAARFTKTLKTMIEKCIGL